MISKLCKLWGADDGEFGSRKKSRVAYLIITVRSTFGLFLDSDSRGILDTSISLTKGMETDARFEVVGDTVFGLGLGFAFRGMSGDSGGAVVVVMYSGMSCEFVRTGETLFAGRIGADKRLFACMGTNVTSLRKSDRRSERSETDEKALTWCSSLLKARPQRG